MPRVDIASNKSSRKQGALGQRAVEKEVYVGCRPRLRRHCSHSSRVWAIFEAAPVLSSNITGRPCQNRNHRVYLL